MRLAIPTVFAVLCATTAPAQVLDNDPCPGYSGVEVIENIECAQAALARADAELNTIWKKAMANHPSGGGDRAAHQEDIRKSQRAWIAFRDLDCEATSQVGIPKYWELNRTYCLYAHTRARAAALKYIYVD